MQKRRLLLSLLLLFLLSAPLEARRRSVRSPSPDDESKLTTAEWLARHAIAFATDQPETGFDDLRGLSTIVGNARIVSLGEATHGTREFFRMKHRVLEYLVENMGFTVFAIEAALPECDAINDYVLNGTGDAATALAGQHFWTWNTDEVLDMIVWMRNYNLRRGAKPPVSFRGFDMQFSEVALTKAKAYLERIDPSGAATITAKWNCWAPYSGNLGNYLSQSSTVRGQCRADLETAYADFEAKRADYVSRSSASEFEQMLHYARVIVQHEQHVAAGRTQQVRDPLMAENVAWFANVLHAGEKLVLWAHNYHVSVQPITMGGHLRELFPGEQMVIFGFAFDHGSFNAVTGGSLTASSVTPFPSGFDPLFRSIGLPRWTADFRNIASTEARQYFATRHTMWSIGAGFEQTPVLGFYREGATLPATYDAIIWFAETTPSRVRVRF